MKILVTGFDRFGGEPTTRRGRPSVALPMRSMVPGDQGAIPDGVRALGRLGPRGNRRARPDVIVSVGRPADVLGEPERVAINIDDGRILTRRRQPIDVPVWETASGLLQLATDQAMSTAMRNAGVPRGVEHRGTYVCTTSCTPSCT